MYSVGCLEKYGQRSANKQQNNGRKCCVCNSNINCSLATWCISIQKSIRPIVTEYHSVQNYFNWT